MIETLEVNQRGLAVDKNIFEEFAPLTGTGNGRVVQMEVKVVVINVFILSPTIPLVEQLSPSCKEASTPL